MLIGDTVNKEKKISEICVRNLVKIPTGWRQTSWPFAKRGGCEFGATEDKSIQCTWQGGGFKPEPPDSKSSALTTRPRSPPYTDIHFSGSKIILSFVHVIKDARQINEQDFAS